MSALGMLLKIPANGVRVWNTMYAEDSALNDSDRPHKPTCTRKELAALAIGALGVVFGDIGTSPLYAIKESFHPGHGIPLTPDNIFGIISLVFWALLLVVSFKYLTFVFRADNKGEGGIMALLALLVPRVQEGPSGRRKFIIVSLALFGAGLLCGEGVITPAISVLSALEGLSVATPTFQPIIVPLTIVILFVLFSAQRKGTARIGAIFGPTMLLWFFSIGAVGLSWVIKRPEILKAMNPLFAIQFMATNRLHGFMVLSAVVLCITGTEALYADIGHFGKKPIQFSWYFLVFPALLLNYFGQGALTLERGAAAIENPFYSMVPTPLLYPMVALATVAAVIASQALISGAFSLAQQAVQLGYLPRTTILHTSRRTEGQIYVPKMNLFLMIACIGLVLMFQESSNLAAAYGIAVTGLMMITSLLLFQVARNIWKWSLPSSVALLSIFLTIDISFFTANLTKIFKGGWIPLSIGLTFFLIMTTWKRGRDFISQMMVNSATTLATFFEQIEKENPPRVKGTAVFMTLTRDIAPSVLLHHFRHNHSLHERVILLSIVTENVPDISGLERVRVTELPHGFIKIVARYGYMETPDINEVLELAQGAGLHVADKLLSYYLGRETIVATGNSGMPHWRKKLFMLLSRNARSAMEFFNLSPDRVIEIGSQIQI